MYVIVMSPEITEIEYVEANDELEEENDIEDSVETDEKAEVAAHKRERVESVTASRKFEEDELAASKSQKKPGCLLRWSMKVVVLGKR
ncbi:hypothetical protein D8674_016453 [Pyrus ussuriensis x Pyrus communis]|uniref:Uncharacterized protein n=1 Tax=Pyrus ussuriensis x Pyrus communis TaxID=2448454 RepID=A0A5N5HDY8_9ROSA|nr:hypothetical protein D8674_016453 [Pyrus ussuriensis x Pyrus communis]